MVLQKQSLFKRLKNFIRALEEIDKCRIVYITDKLGSLPDVPT